MTFNTINKRVIRSSWDKAILTARYDATGRGLYYFGLTGAEMYDVLDWIDLLHRDVTAIEKDSKHFFDIKSQIFDIGYENGLNPEVLRGNVERIVETGRSLDNEPARRASFTGNGVRLAYDLVNLDYIGGNTLMRHRAVEALFAAQSETGFTLFITYNVRTPMIAQISSELATLRDQLDGNGFEMVAWYEAHSHDTLRLKAIVPPIISKAAAAARLDCRSYPPVRYLGDGRTTLVHFAFDLTPNPGSFTGRHPGMRTLMTLPLIDAIDGKLCVSTTQDPDFDRQRCARELEFLPPEERNRLIADLSNKYAANHARHL